MSGFKEDSLKIIFKHLSAEGVDPRSDEFGDRYRYEISNVEAILAFSRDSSISSVSSAKDYKKFYQQHQLALSLIEEKYGDIGTLIYFRIKGHFPDSYSIDDETLDEIEEKYPSFSVAELSEIIYE